MANKFPWDAAMSFGFAVMRLSPSEFWSMTPRELAAAMRAYGIEGNMPMSVDELGKLMRRFPDT